MPRRNIPQGCSRWLFHPFYSFQKRRTSHSTMTRRTITSTPRTYLKLESASCMRLHQIPPPTRNATYGLTGRAKSTAVDNSVWALFCACNNIVFFFPAPQENLPDSDTVMLDTDLGGANGFSIIGPSVYAYAGSTVAGLGVRRQDDQVFLVETTLPSMMLLSACPMEFRG